MTSTTPHRTVLLIGASRGLGLALAEEYLAEGAHVVATVRGPERTALHDLQAPFTDRLEIEAVDITVPDQIAGLRFLDYLGETVAW
jgi:NAD(P)-dependent dehydrogenase (short-subunit alcohol dehydrogenase family)